MSDPLWRFSTCRHCSKKVEVKCAEFEGFSWNQLALQSLHSIGPLYAVLLPERNRIAMAVDLRLDVDATEGLGASLAHEAQRGKFQQSCQ